MNFLNIKGPKNTADFRHVVNTHYKLAFNPFQQFGQLVKISLAEDSFAIVVFAVPIWRGVGAPRPLFNFSYFEITGIKFLSVIRAGYRLMTAGTLAVGLNFRRAVQFGPADVVNG